VEATFKEQLRGLLEDAQQKQKEAMDGVQSAHSAEIDSLKSDHAKEMERLIAAHMKEMDIATSTMTARHEQDLSALKADHATSMQAEIGRVRCELSRERNAELTRLREELEESGRLSVEKAVGEGRARLHTELARVRLEHEEDLSLTGTLLFMYRITLLVVC